MQGLKFKIQHTTGQSEELAIETTRALLGSGAHCEIRLPLDQAANEHVAVSLTPTGLVAEALSFNPPPTINDSPINRSPITEGAVLGVGQTKIWVEIVELEEGAAVKKKQQEKTSPMTYVLAAIAVPISLYILLTDDPPGPPLSAPTEPPELWGEPIKACPQAGRSAALALAEDRIVLADAKRERRPFYVKEGVAAVPLYETAAVCYATAGKKEEAAAAAAAGKKVREQVAEDYRTHRIRLEHALSIDDWRTSQKEVRILLDFTSGIQSEYVTWLDNLDRRLRLKYGSEER